MTASYDVLYLFMAQDGALAEIRRRDLPAGAPKAQLYQWLWLDASAVTTLHFKAMQTGPRQQREFDQARLWFDATQGELRWHDGRVTALAVQAIEPLSPALQQRLSAHLRGASTAPMGEA